MHNTENHIDELIGKYISGEATADETRAVEAWIAASPENGKYFDQLKYIFNKAASISTVQHFNTDAAWNKVKTKLIADKSTSNKNFILHPRQVSLQTYYRIAATVLVVLGLGWLSYEFLSKDDLKPVAVITESKTASDTLPDGSLVFLNKKTKLDYTFDKKKNSHIVKLKGEAFFAITKHEDDKKFIIQADEVYIKDIGTKFNVKNYAESNTIEVVVEEGEVMFYSDADSGVYLKAGGKGVYDRVAKKFSIEEPEPNATAYKTKFFIFTDTDLATVVNTLNEVYANQIVIGDHLKTCRLTATFNNESSEEIANVIAETLGLRVKKSGDLYSLEGAGCGE